MVAVNSYTYTRDTSKDIYEEVSYDTTKPIFDVVTIASDMQISPSSYVSEAHILCVLPNNTIQLLLLDTQQYSGSTAPSGQPYMFWYDTTNNYVKYTTDSGSTWQSGWSLPLAIVMIRNGTGATSINQVFNGFGYIGSTVFTLPGVKGLIPNGRNEDGSLKNIEFTVESVLTQTFPSTYTYSGALVFAYNTLAAWGESDYSYGEEENFVKFKGGNYPAIRIGNIALSTGRITSFTSKMFYQAIDYNDKSTISGWGMPSSRYIDLTIGANGATYTAPANGYFCFNGKDSGNTGTADIVLRNQTRYFGVAGSNTNSVQSPAWSGYILPAKKGDVVSLYYTGTLAFNDANWSWRFYYSEGEA